VNPGGGAGWDESPLDIQIPDDARELDRDVLAYHRELRARRRRNRLRRLASPFARQGTIMPLLASILAVCLVAGAMLSVATFSPATEPATHAHQPTATESATHARQPTAAASSTQSASQRPKSGGTGSPGASTAARPSGARQATRPSSTANPSAQSNPPGRAHDAVFPGAPR
jgi:cytoskeletal protein RodZ